MAGWYWVGRIHRFIYAASGGRVGARLDGMDMCLLTTKGRRTGQPRTTPLSCFARGDAVVVVASNGGQDRDPVWWLNLMANPEAEVQIGRERWRVNGRRATAEEGAKLEPWLRQCNPRYATYQKETSREIPVVIFERDSRRR